MIMMAYHIGPMQLGLEQITLVQLGGHSNGVTLVYNTHSHNTCTEAR